MSAPRLPVLLVDEVYPELSATLGAAWWSPAVRCQAPGCSRPAMLAVELSVRVSAFESDEQVRLCCDLAGCYRSWWALADAVVMDVHPLTRQVAAAVSGLDLGAVA